MIVLILMPNPPTPSLSLSLSLSQIASSTAKHEKKFSNLTTPSAQHVKEGVTDDQEEGQREGTSEFTMEGVANVGSEMDRVHIAERNKAMAAKLKVTCLTLHQCLFYVPWTLIVSDL